MSLKLQNPGRADKIQGRKNYRLHRFPRVLKNFLKKFTVNFFKIYYKNVTYAAFRMYLDNFDIIFIY